MKWSKIKTAWMRAHTPQQLEPDRRLPVEVQGFIRVMGEDLAGARDLLRDMPPLERAVLVFWIEQYAGLVYEVNELEGPGD